MEINGRPTLLDEVDEKGNFNNPKVLALLYCVEEGSFVDNACDYAGIPYDTVNKWISGGKKDYIHNLDTKYARFWQLLKQAKGKAQFYHIKNIKDKAVDSWQASAWYLERTNKNFRIDKEEDKGDDSKVTIVLGTKKNDEND